MCCFIALCYILLASQKASLDKAHKMAEIAAKIKNWAGNYAYSTGNLHHPETVEQIQALVKRNKKLKVLGTRHSFNSIADSTENLILLDRLERVIDLEPEQKRVSISGNVTYGELSPVLHREGFALHNLASLAHISVAGACATATHGSGVRNQGLGVAVSRLEIVTANGNLVTLSREKDGERFDGAVVSLGALGVVVNLTLDLLPNFEARQHVYEALPYSQLEAHFSEIVSAAYSVSLFTTWQSSDINQVWLKQRGDEAPRTDFFGATPASRKMHPIAEIPAENCTEQLGVAGPWHERLPHFRIDALPSAGDELQSEYFVPRERAVEALHALSGLREEFAPYLLVSEIRTIAADNFWMSPCYHQDSVGFHFTWKQDVPAVMKLLPLIEARLAPFTVRPHWGKLFTMDSHRLRLLYEKFPDFQELVREYDPDGKFRNAFLDAVLTET
jgi:xylitol oxidase